MFSPLSNVQNRIAYKEVSSYLTDRNKEQEFLVLTHRHKYSELNHQGDKKKITAFQNCVEQAVNSILGLIYRSKVHAFLISKLPSEVKESIG
jgi:hypothetical protein